MVDLEGTADSMGILSIILSIIGYGAIYVLFTVPMNSMIDTMNAYIAAGMLSEQTYDHFNNALDLWEASPFFLLIGLVLYCFERSKGTDIPIQIYFSYAFLMFSGIIVSCILVSVFGMFLDQSSYCLASQVIWDIPEEWNQSTFINFVTKVIYLGTMVPGYLGCVLYMFHPVIKQKERAYTFEGGRTETEFNLEQF